VVCWSSPATDDLTAAGHQAIAVTCDVNLRGVWACMKHELQQMRTQRSGAIVNNSSLGGLVDLLGRAAYHASKHGVIGLTESAALEYAARASASTQSAQEPPKPGWSPR
jgi:NAD(P)-dependent dehydrogenase (short-subunit alcohol dehydrogenase family)